jgi:ribosome modulation factor
LRDSSFKSAKACYETAGRVTGTGRAKAPVLETGFVAASSAFRLSRIQAQGWNAARGVPGDLDDAKIAALNPHKKDPERARWLAGFRNAMDMTEAK